MRIVPNLSNLSDQELLSLIHSGNQEAFVCIYDRYWPEMYTCAFQIFPQRDICEDLIHDVFLSLWNAKKLLQINSLRDYLYIAVKNRSLNVIRAQKKRFEVLDERSNEIPSTLQTDERLVLKEMESLFDTAVSDLPEKCREILILSRQEQLSNKEIASRLGISPKTVENQITIGLKRIRLGMADFFLLTFFYFFFGG